MGTELPLLGSALPPNVGLLGVNSDLVGLQCEYQTPDGKQKRSGITLLVLDVACQCINHSSHPLSRFGILEATPISSSPFTLLIVLSIGLMGFFPFAEFSTIEMMFPIPCPRDVAFMLSSPVFEDFCTRKG
ncbi:hypothetical protein H5410_021908 [Solanum commersonii]|uniref:Uncharacterized protein n=1 Tax=Solanum commersonii TaxID=4109 RepID=A0A9J5ZCD8_SOLCO|nr:hypothetical protein H5410_021908 [Solanum commersonii]